jgi:hypothetical protein
MGLAKSLNIVGTIFFACYMRHSRVNLSLASASSWMVSTFIACLVTILCHALLGIGVNVVGGGLTCTLGDLLLTPCLSSCQPTFVGPFHSGQMCVFGPMIWTRWIAGTASGVLFRILRQCKRGVFFNARFAVGFHSFIIGGAFMMHGTKRMGVVSITLCCCILTLCSCSLASCSVITAIGSPICLILLWRSLMRRLPVGILFAVAVSLASSSLSVRKCWSGVKFGNWQCCRSNSINPDMQYALVSGM